jgi:hypothetical protein
MALLGASSAHVAVEANGVADCVEGASVRLSKGRPHRRGTKSANYGDFKFDKLDEDLGRTSWRSQGRAVHAARRGYASAKASTWAIRL